MCIAHHPEVCHCGILNKNLRTCSKNLFFADFEQVLKRGEKSYRYEKWEIFWGFSIPLFAPFFSSIFFPSISICNVYTLLTFPFWLQLCWSLFFFYMLKAISRLLTRWLFYFSEIYKPRTSLAFCEVTFATSSSERFLTSAIFWATWLTKSGSLRVPFSRGRGVR